MELQRAQHAGSRRREDLLRCGLRMGAERARRWLGFFRMPGYGAFLAEGDPDVRKRQADVGAPEGFEDAVAWLVPATAETPADAKPAHWSVTFAVDDADAIADRAVELGGTVLVPPVDAPWVRMTVVADPQGAMFTASKFTPT